MLIHEFHSKLDPRNDQSLLFNALRRLRLLRQVTSFATQEGGWIVWADQSTDPDDGGSFRFSAAAIG
ncbi:MAG TPA: hypothetical protein VJ725_28830 [Thermoanaerobaculia bacterium]|nr:hypothetical protein [Thermoanaerobaculia bacterium]